MVSSCQASVPSWLYFLGMSKGFQTSGYCLLIEHFVYPFPCPVRNKFSVNIGQTPGMPEPSTERKSNTTSLGLKQLSTEGFSLPNIFEVPEPSAMPTNLCSEGKKTGNEEDILMHV